METTKQTPEDQFRSGVEDALTLCRALSAHCASVEELAGLLELALTNDAQLRLLRKEVVGKAR